MIKMRFFTKSNDNCIYSPVEGMCLDISECIDNTFSMNLMGDGVMISPENNVVCSPCDGKLTMIFPTLHAFGVKLYNGYEILVHIGVDTANLNGKHFKQLTQVGKKVRKNEPIIEVDFNAIKEKGYDCNVMIVLVGKDEIQKQHIDEYVDKSNVIMRG